MKSEDLGPLAEMEWCQWTGVLAHGGLHDKRHNYAAGVIPDFLSRVQVCKKAPEHNAWRRLNDPAQDRVLGLARLLFNMAAAYQMYRSPDIKKFRECLQTMRTEVERLDRYWKDRLESLGKEVPERAPWIWPGFDSHFGLVAYFYPDLNDEWQNLRRSLEIMESNTRNDTPQGPLRQFQGLMQILLEAAAFTSKPDCTERTIRNRIVAEMKGEGWSESLWLPLGESLSKKSLSVNKNVWKSDLRDGWQPCPDVMQIAFTQFRDGLLDGPLEHGAALAIGLNKA